MYLRRGERMTAALQNRFRNSLSLRSSLNFLLLCFFVGCGNKASENHFVTNPTASGSANPNRGTMDVQSLQFSPHDGDPQWNIVNAKDITQQEVAGDFFVAAITDGSIQLR